MVRRMVDGPQKYFLKLINQNNMLDDRSGINWSLFKVHEYEKGAFVKLKAFIRLT